MNYKKFGILTIILYIGVIIGYSAFVMIIDPYFHYHKPFINYKLDKQRYQNDGIVKNFDYDTIITGTSMTENFKTTEVDDLFHTKSIKVPLSGAYYKEINELLNNALESNSNIKYIIRSLDYYFFTDKDSYAYASDSYPIYLYNNNLFDDVYYVFNKEIFVNAISMLNYKESTTFNQYSYWGDNFVYGKTKLDSGYNRPQKSETYQIRDIDIQTLRDNITQNVVSTVEKYPNVQFYFFYPPYSIYCWDNYNQLGILEKNLYGEKIVTEMLLPYDNVHVFSFWNAYDLITDLNYYKDIYHYSPSVNSMILNSMNLGEYEITMDNLENYYDTVLEYYTNYDYDSLFEKDV